MNIKIMPRPPIMDTAIVTSTAVYFRPGIIAGDIIDSELNGGFHGGSRVRCVRSPCLLGLVLV